MSDITSPTPLTDPPAKSSLLGDLWASVAVTLILGVICCGLYPLAVWAVAQVAFPHQANGSLLKKDGSYTTKDDEAVGSALLGQNFALAGYFHPRPSAAGSNGYDPTSSGGSNLGPLSDKLINGQAAAPATQPSTQPVLPAYDGIRLRTLHYAADNGLAFKLYTVRPDGTRSEVPLRQYRDAAGNLNDEALVEAFPHPPADAPGRAVLVVGDGVHPPFATADGKPVYIPADAVTASGSGLDPHISPDNAALQAQRVADARKVSVDQVKALVELYTDKADLGILGDPGVNVLRLNLAMDAKYPLPAAPATQPSK